MEQYKARLFGLFITALLGGFGYFWVLSIPTHQDVSALEVRVHRLEVESEHLPSKDDFVDLRVVVTRLAAQLDALDDRLANIEQLLKERG